MTKQKIESKLAKLGIPASYCGISGFKSSPYRPIPLSPLSLAYPKINPLNPVIRDCCGVVSISSFLICSKSSLDVVVMYVVGYFPNCLLV